MDFRMEKVPGASRDAYIIYDMQMRYLATVSWYRGHLIYDTVMPALVGTSAKIFEEAAREQDKEVGQ